MLAAAALPPHDAARTTAEANAARLARRGWLLGLARLAAVLSVVLTVGMFIGTPDATRFALIIVASAVVLGLGLALRAVDDQRRRWTARIDHHRRGLERCADRWAAGPVDAAPADHPYAHDLDLVGPLGLLARLGSDLSPAGRQTPSARALDDTTPVQGDRPAAIRSLTTLHDWRARLATALSESGESAPLVGLITALKEGFPAPAIWQRALAWLLRATGAAAFAAALVYWGPDGALTTLLGVAVVLAPIDGGIARRFARLGDSDRLRSALAGLAQGLTVAAELYDHADPLLRRLGTRCAAAQSAARQLARRLAAVAQRRDPLWSFLICGPLQLATHDAVALATWANAHCTDLASWRSDLAEVETLAALATWAAEQGGCWPEWRSDGALLQAQALAHPLLPRTQRRGNDVRLDQGTVWLITGANASGKSTWLRSCALAVVLARLGTTVPAERLSLRPLRIAATMRAGDDLAAGLSRFQAEVAALARAWKRLDHPGEPLLLVLDEILAGTNSHERHLASRALIARLAGASAVTLISTHDLALASLADEHPQRVHLAHFADRAASDSDDLAFDYLLRPGVTRTTNALTVLRRAGIPLDG